MNEEQAILDFFAQTENLSLGLSVAEQMDKLRERMNNRFWQELQTRLDILAKQHDLSWRIGITEDKNAPDSLVGLHCAMNVEQPLYLRPMLEQQYFGDTWRIYFGLIWSGLPAPGKLGLPAVTSLKEALRKAGFKSNENFLAWRWTKFYPRRKDFLLRYSLQPEALLSDIEEDFKTLLIDHHAGIDLANSALLNDAPGSLAAALNQLRDELTD